MLALDLHAALAAKRVEIVLEVVPTRDCATGTGSRSGRRKPRGAERLHLVGQTEVHVCGREAVCAADVLHAARRASPNDRARSTPGCARKARTGGRGERCGDEELGKVADAGALARPQPTCSRRRTRPGYGPSCRADRRRQAIAVPEQDVLRQPAGRGARHSPSPPTQASQPHSRNGDASPTSESQVAGAMVERPFRMSSFIGTRNEGLRNRGTVQASVPANLVPRWRAAYLFSMSSSSTSKISVAPGLIFGGEP